MCASLGVDVEASPRGDAATPTDAFESADVGEAVAAPLDSPGFVAFAVGDEGVGTGAGAIASNGAAPTADFSEEGAVFSG
jgi:hypothetical protein